MSTRSLIGYKRADGSVDAIYCHFDGYLNGVGACLVESWNDDGLANHLVKGGDTSSVGNSSASTEYYSKRGESCPPRQYKSQEDFVSNADGLWHEYLYLWDGECWVYCTPKKGGYTKWNKVKKGLTMLNRLSTMSSDETNV